MIFGRRKKAAVSTYGKNGKVPIIRCSICTGAQVAGFKGPVSGRFEELMLLRDDKDLAEALQRYQVEEREIKRAW